MTMRRANWVCSLAQPSPIAGVIPHCPLRFAAPRAVPRDASQDRRSGAVTPDPLPPGPRDANGEPLQALLFSPHQSTHLPPPCVYRRPPSTCGSHPGGGW
jgi:hypothetical protein